MASFLMQLTSSCLDVFLYFSKDANKSDSLLLVAQIMEQ